MRGWGACNLKFNLFSPLRTSFETASTVVNIAFAAAVSCRGKVILTAAKQVAKWTLPSFLCRDNLGKPHCVDVCAALIMQGVQPTVVAIS